MKWIDSDLGVEIGVALAGFWGAVASLSFIPQLKPYQAIGIVLVGTVTAMYLTPLVVPHLPVWVGDSESLKRGVAFVLGVTGMSIVGGIVKLGHLFQKDPLKVIRGTKGES